MPKPVDLDRLEAVVTELCRKRDAVRRGAVELTPFEPVPVLPAAPVSSPHASAARRVTTGRRHRADPRAILAGGGLPLLLLSAAVILLIVTLVTVGFVLSHPSLP